MTQPRTTPSVSSESYYCFFSEPPHSKLGESPFSSGKRIVRIIMPSFLVNRPEPSARSPPACPDSPPSRAFSEHIIAKFFSDSLSPFFFSFYFSARGLHAPPSEAPSPGLNSSFSPKRQFSLLIGFLPPARCAFGLLISGTQGLERYHAHPKSFVFTFPSPFRCFWHDSTSAILLRCLLEMSVHFFLFLMYHLSSGTAFPTTCRSLMTPSIMTRAHSGQFSGISVFLSDGLVGRGQ